MEVIGITIIQGIIVISLMLFLVSFIPYQHSELEKTLNTKTGDKANQELVLSALHKMEGIEVRIHNDVQQILNHTNGTSRIIDIVPHNFP